MKILNPYFFLGLFFISFISCSKDSDSPVANQLTLSFNNTFKDETIILGDASSSLASVNTSAKGQEHRFSEVKYVISNIRLIKADGGEIPYHINDLDKGATVINQAKPQTLDYVMTNIPAGEYKQIKFGLGVKQGLNTLDEVKFPGFYAEAGANDTKMMWEWGTGYRFTKIEGFYEIDNKELSIHTGSTLDGNRNDPSSYVPGVDAYRDVVLTLPQHAMVGKIAPKIMIKADFDKLLSGKVHTITLSSGRGDADNATPNVHTAVEMMKFVDNLGGNGENDISGMFSIEAVNN
ncbi:hypothetical protein ORI89_08915 [Sphingobacterium sp. UT-1RO-CII-1]|uniref:MbnP family protein n=1 Tax=Sphingobacterium sp. UT-1RO-CII-1 TaxID=2995225 RepID=UPI00227CDB7E|nr:MbnP family protein [Sphingobacterium sp. UT-1RO-CII-1]MCY4779772.1 hypothetical protein [Sphingobacterium sp. UT-1RO-CII-1]